MAIVKALSITPKEDMLTTVMDSMFSIQGIYENLRNWEDKGWMRVQNAAIFQKIAYELDTREGETYFQWVKATQTTPEMIGQMKK